MAGRFQRLLDNPLPWVLLVALAAALCLQELRSVDYWWHLRTGELIAETGSVPKADPFTYSVPGTRWIDIHWLHQLGLWALHRLGGHGAVVVAKLVMVLALLALLAPIGRRRERDWLSVGALTLLLLVACTRFTPRPELTSFALLAASLRLLDRFERTGDAAVYALVPVQLVWANVHGLFALGPALCAMHWVGELLRPLGAAGAHLRPQRLRRLAALSLLAALACLANPNGLEGALYPLEQLRMIGSAEQRGFFGQNVRELAPPIGAMAPAQLSVFLLLAALSLAALVGNWRRARLADFLGWVAFFYLAMGAKRNTALFAIVAAPLLVRNANELIDRRALPAGLGHWAAALLSALLALLAVDAARGDFYPRLGNFRSPGLGVTPAHQPTAAVDWIARHRPPGPLAHQMSEGGYLIFRLHPDYPVLLDGRLEVFGAERFRELLIADPDDFRRLDERYGFGSALVKYDDRDADALLGWLLSRPAWQLTHVDDVASVFVRTPYGREPAYAPIEPGDPNLFPALDGSRGWLDARALSARARFYIAAGRTELAAASLRQLVELFPGSQAAAFSRDLPPPEKPAAPR